ncbi:hypothetical protein ACYT7O_11055, partial [Streptococcus pyogenes]
PPTLKRVLLPEEAATSEICICDETLISGSQQEVHQNKEESIDKRCGVESQLESKNSDEYSKHTENIKIAAIDNGLAF